MSSNCEYLSVSFLKSSQGGIFSWANFASYKTIILVNSMIKTKRKKIIFFFTCIYKPFPVSFSLFLASLIPLSEIKNIELDSISKQQIMIVLLTILLYSDMTRGIPYTPLPWVFPPSPSSRSRGPPVWWWEGIFHPLTSPLDSARRHLSVGHRASEVPWLQSNRTYLIVIKLITQWLGMIACS